MIKNRSTRNYWVHPLLRVKYVEGAFYTIFYKLVEDEIKFFNYFRMSFTTFNLLLKQISDFICRQEPQMSLCIPSKEIIMITKMYVKNFINIYYKLILYTTFSI